MAHKDDLKERARRFAGASGILRVDHVRLIFNVSDSCVYKWIGAGKLDRLKYGLPESKAPVRILLPSVIEFIDTFTEE